jgi:excisionase family DNA binding protein
VFLTPLFRYTNRVVKCFCVRRPIDARGGNQTMELEPLLVSKKEAAALLGISLRQVDYVIAQGKLRTRRIGRRVLLPFRAVRQFAGETPKAQKACKQAGVQNE